MLRLVAGAIACTAIAGFASAPTSAAAQETLTLRVHTFMPPVANPVKHFLTPWAEKVTRESGGKMKVQIFPAMGLGGKAPQLLQQVRDGVVDIVWTLPGYTPGVMPRLETFELPFLHRSALSTVLAVQDFAGIHLKDELKDYHPILIHAHSGVLFMTKGPVNKLEDFKGLKLRSPSRTGAWAIEALGATPIQVDLPELPQMMSKGTVDGSILVYEIAPAVKMQELATYFTTLSPPQPRMATAIFSFLMNKKRYESLPPDLKKVIDDNSGRNIAKLAAETWDMIELAGENVMRSVPKNRFVTVGPQETARTKAAVQQPVYARFKEEMKRIGADGDKLIADAGALIEKYSTPSR